MPRMPSTPPAPTPAVPPPTDLPTPPPCPPPHTNAARVAESPAPTPLSALRLDDVLTAQREGRGSSQEIWETLMSLSTVSGRELRDSCLVARPADPEGLTFTMATLFCTPERRRTLADLERAGIFVGSSRRTPLAPEDAGLLTSDEGLRLWLRYAASPSAYPSLFIDAILGDTFPPEPPPSLMRALRVLIACGRDTTNDVPISNVPGECYLPLSHMCSHVAAPWLPSLLHLGANPNQVTASGVPLVASAMAAQADRLHTQGHDLLIAHDSLYRLGKTLCTHGADLAMPSRKGSPPVMLLALNGYCAAAEVLLALGASCNTAAGDPGGNTLMHQLAAATRHKACSFTAFFLFTLALRYGGDPGQANHAGVTALSLLPDSLSHFARLTQKMIAQARERARHVIANPKPQSPEERNGTLPRVSAVMMAQARRLCEAGHDPLLPHESLFASATTLRREGVDLTQMHLDGSPPVLWLALRGYCGAAEVLLAHEPDCNVPRFAGNTLMHYLAAATRCSSDAIYADYMLNTALRYGGDPTICNLAGDSALTPLTPDRIRFLRAGLSFIDQTRKSATLMVNSRHGPLARANPPSPGPSPSASMRHSAAAQ